MPSPLVRSRLLFGVFTFSVYTDYMVIFAEIYGKLLNLSAVAANTWWLWLPLVLLFIARGLWLEFVNTKYVDKVPWVFLEIRSPREIIKSAKTMEQIFANMHSLRNNWSNWYEKYVDGEIALWFSMEMVAAGGGLRFFVRTPGRYVKAVDAFFHSQYPDVEIFQVEDYTKSFPETFGGLREKGYNLWGTELRLVKEDAYPIRTYVEFESQTEEQNLDPIASLVELAGKCQSGEQIWIQVLIRSAGDEWQKAGLKLVKRIKEESQIPVTTVEGATFHMSTPKTPGEIETLKAVEKNISKPGFYTLIRYVYFAPKEVYNRSIPQKAMLGVFSQYGSTSLNTFNHNYGIWTMIEWHFPPFVFPKSRLRARKSRVYRKFRERDMPEQNEGLLSKIMTFELFNWASFKLKTFVLNAEELATIYHLPTIEVTTAPVMKKVESRRIGPPQGLDIFKEE